MSRAEEEAKRVAWRQASTAECCGQPIVKMPVEPFTFQGKTVTHAMVCTKCKIGFYLFDVGRSDCGEGMVGSA